MYAIIQSGGRQLRVEPGTVVSVDGRPAATGEQIVFDQVLFVASDDGNFLTGAPVVTGGRVVGTIDGQTQGPKIRVFQKKRRKMMRRTLGHRAKSTRVRITNIETDSSHGS